MFESLVMGMVQGIAEWLPVSSEAMIVLVKTNFFPEGISFSEIISYAIFLHLGTLLAAVVYFRKRVFSLILDSLRYFKQEKFRRNEIEFIVLVTLISGVLGIMLLKIVAYYESFFSNQIIINMIVAILLFCTAGLLYITEQKKHNDSQSTLSPKSAWFVGIFQGLSALPGISRSGSTIAAMGLMGVEKKRALELSFILSIPLVLGANIFLNFDSLQKFDVQYMVALLSSFVFGIATIHLLLRLVERIRFSIFVGAFASILLIFVCFQYFL